MAQFRYIEGVLTGLGLCHELVHSAWDIVNGSVEGVLTDAQQCYIDKSLKGLGLCHELVHSAWEIVKGTVFGPLTAVQFRYIEGNLKGLGLCHELGRSAWDIVNGGVEGTLTEEQFRCIKGASKGLQKWQKACIRRAEVALLIREKRADEATEGEREEHKKGVVSGKKAMCKYNCNIWVIKSKVQDKVLEFGKQKACELTDSSRGLTLTQYRTPPMRVSGVLSGLEWKNYSKK